MLRSLAFFFLLQVSNFAWAEHPYYGEEFYKNLQNEVSSEQVLTQLKAILRSGHIPKKGSYDVIVPNCSSQQNCYEHQVLGYKKARQILMGDMYLVSGKNGYGVQEVYCSKVYDESQFKSQKPGPGLIPNHTILNCEHTWPQSRFSSRHNTEMQVSDLQHLYPTDSRMNSIRSNFKLGEVQGNASKVPCVVSKFGQSQFSKAKVFEPPTEHKGNAARSLLYFSVRYDLPIDSAEESFLRKWHEEDPVDAEEIKRHEKIFANQKNRNPFIDHPELVDKIANF